MAALCGKTDIDRLPPESTVIEIYKRILVKSHMHLAEVLPEKENLTLLRNENTDRRMTVEGFNM